MSDIILHHYDASPYSEKIRLLLGFKGIDWQSVTTPVIAPKPLLTPLTGGYRKTPVMQIGADIYCDSDIIALELEDRFPEPRAIPEGRHGVCAVWNRWVDSSLFFVAARLKISYIADRLPDEFHRDRAAMMGTEPNVEALKAAGPHLRAQLYAQLQWLDQHLETSEFLLGEQPGYADFAVYHPVWFVLDSPVGAQVAESFPRIAGWASRIKAVGHGSRSEMDGRNALETARLATPVPVPESPPDAVAELPMGSHASVKPEAFGREAVTGEVGFVSNQRITLVRNDEAIGRIHVHFPRVGYVVTPLPAG